MTMVKNNPYANVFYNDFQQRFIKPENKDDNAVVADKFRPFVKILNDFLAQNTNDKPQVKADGYKISSKEWVDFILSLRATMIANATKIDTLSEKYSRSPEIIGFFEKVKDFCIANSSKLQAEFDYDVFKRNKATGKLETADDWPDTDKKSVFFWGVNRSGNNIEEVNRMFRHSTKDLFDDEIFVKADIYSVAMPNSFPEEIAASTILQTIEKPQDFRDCDRFFAEEYWSEYVGKDLAFDEEGKIIEGEAYSTDELAKKLQNLKIISYCAGAANAHRSLNALKNIAAQLYDEPDLDKAWKNIQVVSYAFPLENEKIDYNCTAIMCNDVRNLNNPETVILTNFPTQYRKLYCPEGQDVKISSEDNCRYVALALPENVPEFSHEGKKVSRVINNRNGHRLQNVTAKNAESHNFEVMRYIVNCALNDEKVEDAKIRRIAAKPNAVLLNLRNQQEK